MSQEQLEAIEKARAEAQASVQKFEEVFEKTATEPRGPIGPPPEARKHAKISVKELEGFPKPERKPRPSRPMPKERVVTRTRTRILRIRSSRGPPVMTGSHKLESSGRISTELNPVQASRLANLREYIRAFQNRKELKNLEKVWRKTRAQRTHDAELRP